MTRTGWWARWKEKAEQLETQVEALLLACRHPGTPWYARLLALLVVAYSLSPIDLIPDFIPVLGYLDDLLIVPGGVWLAIRLVPPGVMDECRAQARERRASSRPRWMGIVVILVWLAALALAARWLWSAVVR